MVVWNDFVCVCVCVGWLLIELNVKSTMIIIIVMAPMVENLNSQSDQFETLILGFFFGVAVIKCFDKINLRKKGYSQAHGYWVQPSWWQSPDRSSLHLHLESSE